MEKNRQKGLIGILVLVLGYSLFQFLTNDEGSNVASLKKYKKSEVEFLLEPKSLSKKKYVYANYPKNEAVKMARKLKQKVQDQESVEITESDIPTKSKIIPPRKIKSNLPQLEVVKVGDEYHLQDSASGDFVSKVNFKGDVAVVQGDIAVGSKELIDSRISNGLKASILQANLWKNKVIAYVIDPNLTNVERVISAINDFNSQVKAIKFQPRVKEPNYVEFTQATDKDLCASVRGFTGGKHPIYLGRNCNKTNVQHEMLHILGSGHEQSRTDRDNYINILWENIPIEFFSRYQKESNELNGKSTRFSFSSIMLDSPRETVYNKDSFSWIDENGKAPSTSIELDSGIQPIDIERIELIYGDKK